MFFAMPTAPGVIDLDFDGYADIVYVGDLGGNLWKWVVRNIGHDAVNSSNPSTAQDGAEDGAGGLQGWAFGKLFSTSPYPAPPAAGPRHYRSFFFSPAATLKNNVLWLAFGSGERADLPYPGITTTPDENNRFYSIKDLDPYWTAGVAAPMTESAPNGVVDLTAATDCVDVNSRDGFYVQGADGEKFVTNSDILNYNVVVASYKPVVSSDPCVSGGEARLYAFKIYCAEGMFEDGGGNTVTNISLGDGMPTDPRISLSGTSGEIFVNKNDRVESIGTGGIDLSKTGMAFWRELFN
jgi:type IV pilus assembly protein PilY1